MKLRITNQIPMKFLLTMFFIGVLSILFVACQGEEAQSGNQEQAENTEQNEEAEGSEEAEESGETGENMILATTTSTEDSGLLDELIPMFEEQTGFNVQTIAVGTGQALAMGEQGEADALLTHAPEAEEELEEEGTVINRTRVMYNDYVVLGPDDDPLGVEGLELEEGMKQIHEEEGIFVSRGDDSGTHKKELDIWELIDVDPQSNAAYVETGQGMGDTLRVASDREGYVLTDRGTYLSQQDLLDNLNIHIEGDEFLHNIYHVMQVNPELSELIHDTAAEQFVSFMVSEEVQDIVETFGVEEYGEPLFFPDAE